MNEYVEFLNSKSIVEKPSGFDPNHPLNPNLFQFQEALVRWALKRGRSALFEGCGMGKTPQQLEWGNQIHRHMDGNVILLAPLAVSIQTVQEAKKFGIDVTLCESQADVKAGINITNYEKLHKFDVSEFAGVILDESSILKNFTGAIRNEIIESFRDTHYKLACTATPAPNDYMELGNHAEFLGIMTRTEMLSMIFAISSAFNSRLVTYALEYAVVNRFCDEWCEHYQNCDYDSPFARHHPLPLLCGLKPGLQFGA